MEVGQVEFAEDLLAAVLEGFLEDDEQIGELLFGVQIAVEDFNEHFDVEFVLFFGVGSG